MTHRLLLLAIILNTASLGMGNRALAQEVDKPSQSTLSQWVYGVLGGALVVGLVDKVTRVIAKRKSPNSPPKLDKDDAVRKVNGYIPKRPFIGGGSSAVYLTPISTERDTRWAQIALHIAKHAIREDWRLAYRTKCKFADKLLVTFEEAEKAAEEEAFTWSEGLYLAQTEAFASLDCETIDELIDQIVFRLQSQRHKSAKIRGREAFKKSLKLVRGYF